ncbi:hypothetical protein D4Z93_03455 [Clostridium fermenticellae]|uniref:Pycsar effector protein domain-containing protein n=1 Tax=Clostridium fermenticellae TaxID=2068654 RepID=A0A386H1P4_9CLOT|nr:hypothetical protein [Clostridium fermenticellae]AYD39609.1 hypothetical protein D4Z93_03360 [Clostridium fermenticellae]AYD39627.1 hypothetical protein D4Z93_03455 [Clostridium fermenticellae]
MNNELETLYSDVKEWLKFAETKNAALITFDTAVLFFLLNLYVKTSYTNFANIEILYCIGLVISILICLSSYVAKLTNGDFLQHFFLNFIGTKNATDNYLYYKDICKYTHTELETAYQKLFNKSKCTNYELCLINQIQAISSLAYKKYFLFNLSLFLIIIEIVFSIIILIVA